jgi:transposase
MTKYAHPGRPATDTAPDIVAYRLAGTISASEEALENAKKSLGKFIIATNQLDEERLSTRAMLEHYTAQGVSVERGFRFLKDPLFFAHSLFLKKPKRIMDLVMIMTISLLMRQLLNLRPIHIQILRLFGKPVQNCYSLDP